MQTLPSIARLRSESPLGRVVEAYERDRDSDNFSLDSFWEKWNATHSDPLSSLATIVKLDLQVRFERGDRPRVADYLKRFPGLREDGDQVVSLIYEEYCLRKESGEDVDSFEFCETYGDWRDSVISQLQYHRDLGQLVDNSEAEAAFPKIGERFDKYTLLKILGTGAVGKVYLAEEDDLEGRKLVIKLSHAFGREPTILAKLDHPNIVPILTFAKSETGLRGICMPYRPGQTLDRTVRRLTFDPPPTTSRDLLAVLPPPEKSDVTLVDEGRPGWERFPADRPFSEGVAWIGLALSDALGYLHAKGIFHRDIKPANILLAHREGPQLLDFNLSEDPGNPGNVSSSMKGGTLPYMAPEHLQAFIDVAGWKLVGVQADLYSLGLVLRELATGCPPELPDPGLPMNRAILGLIISRARPFVPARELNPLIPPSLDSILDRCLAFECTDRYTSAQELSEDLRRFLNRRALRYAPNTSKAERGLNWLFRNRLAILGLVVASILLATFLMVRTQVSIPDRSEFRRAVRQLDSKTQSDQEKAQATFERLQKENPRSAWATLYLARSLEIRKPNDPQEISRLYKEALEMPDAEQALVSLLEIEPNSATLRTNYGIFLIKQHNEANARKELERALQIEPRKMMALSALLNLERTSKNFDRAIALNLVLIDAAVELNIGWDKVYAFRNVMVPSLAKLVDQAIEQGKSATDRARAIPHLDAIEATIAAMSEDRKKIPLAQGIDLHLYTEHFYRGFVALNRGILATDQKNYPSAKICFDDARRHFGEALTSISPRLANQKNYKQPIIQKQATLQSWIDRLPKESASASVSH